MECKNFSKHTETYIEHLEKIRDDENLPYIDREAVGLAIFHIKMSNDARGILSKELIKTKGELADCLNSR